MTLSIRRRCLTVSVFVAALAITAQLRALERDVVVSIYQGTVKEGDFTANLATARTVVRQAIDRGSQFLAFPETFLSGYASRELMEQGARPLNDPELQTFIDESKSHDVVVMIGMARKTSEGIYNSILVIHRGKLLGIYDKVLLTGGDSHELRFLPGKAVPVFTAHGARFAVIVCHDTSFPHVAMAARLEGAELLFTPHNNEILDIAAQDHMRWVRNCHIGLACQLKMVVARANNVKMDKPHHVGYGASFILSPQGEPLAEAPLYKSALITATVTPKMFSSPYVWANFHEVPSWLNEQVADLLTAYRRPTSDDELKYWLENMVVYHHYTPDEVCAATGLTLDEFAAAARKLELKGKTAPPRAKTDPLRVLPYPGGRHPRTGFLDGAVNPQRETKISVFTPWDDNAYVVVDVPEAVFSNLGLIYLAHTHVPTIWSQQDIKLPRLEWTREADGKLHLERTLPNGIAFGSKVTPDPTAVRMEMWLRNGTPEKLTGLRVQVCVMLKGAAEFSRQTDENSLLQPPYAACKSPDGKRWLITAWDPVQRAWANPPVPCVHSDPIFPDCAPGDTVRVRGWLSFYEGTDIQSEITRIDATGWRTAP